MDAKTCQDRRVTERDRAWWDALPKLPKTEMTGEAFALEAEFLHYAIGAHPAQKAFEGWEALGMVRAALRSSAGDLIALFQAPNEDERLAIALMSNLGPDKGAFKRFSVDLFRYLVGYLGLVSTLIDHSRRLTDDYQDAAFQAEYARRKDALSDTGVAPFLKDLRNVLLHARFAPLRVEVRHEKGEFAGATVLMRSDELLAMSKKWSAGAKRYLRERDEVDIARAAREYEALIESTLYSWLPSQFLVLHAADLADLQPLRDRYDHFFGDMRDVEKVQESLRRFREQEEARGVAPEGD